MSTRDERERTDLSDIEHVRTTPEVGDEGGTPGDFEIGSTDQVGTGSEATETWRRRSQQKADIPRDETGPGRRSP